MPGLYAHPHNRTRLIFNRGALYLSVSALALVVASSDAFSRPLGGRAAPAPTQAAIAAAQSAQADAVAAARSSASSLLRATSAIQALQASQQAARDAALAAPSNTITNGLRPGGLQIGADVVRSDGSVNGDLWQGAGLPTEFANGARANVTIRQTQQKAILTWQTFNVGRETDLYFDQRAGGADAGQWIALNRVMDPSGAPSRILGSIKAEGQVYVINRNGIIFGGSSQVNVGTLLASSLDIKGLNTNLVADRDDAFLNGLFAGGSAVFQSRKRPDATGALVIPDTIEGNVVVEAGAVLRSRAASGLDDGGRIMLFGPNVRNAGSILTADGQAVLAAGRTVTVSTGADKQLQFAATPAVPFGDPFYLSAAYAGEPAYRAQNTGFISAERGAIVMRGTLVEQAGVLTATTSVNRPGSVSLVADGRVTLASGSTIAMDADATRDADGKEVTAPAFNGGLNVSLSGSSVDVQADTMIRAPSGKVTITATNASAMGDTHANIPDDNGRVFLAPGSVIDVSGLTDVLVPVERAIIKVQPRGQEFANSPLQRNSVLRGKDIWIDSRITGVRDDGVAWIGSPLLDASGYVGLIQKSTREYLVGGGSVSINGQKDVVLPRGVTVNVSGGYVRYTGGSVHTTRLIGADGRIYDVAKADPMMTYLGIFGAYTRNHARWGISETWTSPLNRTMRDEPGYYEGAAAGSLDLVGAAVGAIGGGIVYFDGAMVADTIDGERQIAQSRPAAGGKLSITSQGNIVVTADGKRLPADMSAVSALPVPNADIGGGVWSWLSADALSDAKLGSFKVTTPAGILVTGDARLEVVPGGSIALSGGVVRVDGKLKAPSGSIDLGTVLHRDAVISLPSEILRLVPSIAGGVLAANASAPMDLITTEAIVIPAGKPLPIPFAYQRTRTLPGEAILDRTNLGGFTLEGPWTVEASVGNVSTYDRINPSNNPPTVWLPGQTIPAGYKILSVVLPVGYVPPASAFPTGVPLRTPVTTYVPAGGVAPMDVTVAAGSAINEGTRLPLAVRVAPTLGRFGSVTVSAGATLNTRGLWVDDRIAPSAYGARFIDGGDITLATNASSFSAKDNTGDIALKAGSIVDASSGGHILLSGAWASRDGIPLGRGGDISILSYAGIMFSRTSVPGGPSLPSDLPVRSFITLDGTLSSYGFSGGGTLTLRANSLVIGPGQTALGRLVLGHGFFHDNSFGGYALSSINDATILDGTADAPVILAPRQVNYVLTGQGLAAGADPLAAGAVATGLLPDYRRQAVNFALDGNVYYNHTTQFYMDASGRHPLYGVADKLTLGANTKIIADAGAAVRLSTAGTLTIAGQIYAPGGTIEIAAPERLKSFSCTSCFVDPSAVWLAPTAVLDASGTILIDDIPRANGSFASPKLGRVLDGGTVTVASAQGFTVAMAGASIDVSGVAGELDVLRTSSDLLSAGGSPQRQSLAHVNPYTRQSVWSDGGIINLTASSGLLFDGTLWAGAGDPRGRGGTLNYKTQGANPTLTAVPSATVPGTVTLGSRALFDQGGQYWIRTDLIQRSGADTLTISGADIGPTSVVIEDGVSLTMADSIRFLRVGYYSLAAARLPAIQSADGPVASLSASHIELSGYVIDLPSYSSSGTLNFNARSIDVDGALVFNIQNTNLIANGDIRLLGIVSPPDGAFAYTRYDGLLATAGDLTLTAGQIYPATGQTFTIAAIGDDSTIRFVQNGSRPAIPLSAGGALQITAPHIVQGGTIRAPQGSISFGNGPYGAFGLSTVTQSVDFLPGSLTSVSLEGATIPYGTTQDQLNWVFGDLELTAPPDKVISINAGVVNMARGAVFDLSAGGDLVAPEFVPGTGGSRDVLQQTIVTRDANGNVSSTTPLYPDNRQIYAIMPRYSGSRAPADKSAAGVTSYGDVYLTGVPGLADGYYTLLPAQYAVLPGAYRVVARPSGDPRVGGVRPDGTIIAAGFYASSDHARRDAGVTIFEVQSRDVWRQYSEYKLTSANEFFGNLEVLHTEFAPYRPQDAGRLAISAADQLTLQAQMRFGTVAGGRGGRIDIGGRDLQILGQGGVARDGYLGISAADLANSNAESILIGGTRSADSTGLLVTAVANSILVSNDEGSALVAPELLFAIRTDASGTDPNAANGLAFEAGSVVIGEGTVSQTVALRTSGDGALVRVSGGGFTAISNSNAPASSTARVLVASGARLVGKGSIALQSAGNVNLQRGAILATRNIDVLTQSISLVGGGVAAPSSGFVLDAASLAVLDGIDNIKLTSTTTIDSYGDVAVIRSSGAIYLGALEIRGAENIRADGEIKGIPKPAASVGSLNLETKDRMAADAAKDLTQTGAREQSSIIIVEVIGYGGSDTRTPGEDGERQHKRGQDQEQGSYDPNSIFRVVGSGELTAEQKQKLTSEERANLGSR